MLHLAYVAGFIDGEGCIRIDKSYPEKRSTHHKLQVIVVNTNYEILKEFQNQFGGAIHKHIFNGHIAYYWNTYGLEATNLLESIKDYIQVKKEQLQLALEFQNKKTIFKASPGNKLSQEELNLRESYYQKMKLLNARKPVTTTKGHLSEMMV